MLPFSPMTPAMGGPDAFHSLSPSLLFGALAAVKRAVESDSCGIEGVEEILLLLEKRQWEIGQVGEQQQYAAQTTERATSEPRMIEPVEAFLEQEREGVLMAVQLLMSEFRDLAVLRSLMGSWDASNGGQDNAILIRKSIPPYLLFSSNHDVVVPPRSSLELNAHLEALGVDGQNVLYDYLDHGGFAMWDVDCDATHNQKGNTKTKKRLMDVDQCNFVERLLEVVSETISH